MKILIPNFIREENPIAAEMCDIINNALAHDPYMSLEAFAKLINDVNQEKARERLERAVERQLRGLKNV